MARAASLLLLTALLIAGFTAAGLPFTAPALAQEDPPDPYDSEPGEWEEQVATDARGDVLVTWPGSIDLTYLTIGELFSVGRMETFLFLRVGYEITEPGNETAYVPNDLPVPGLPDPPPTSPSRPLALVNVSFLVDDGESKRPIRISLWTFDYGRTWGTDQGQFVAGHVRESGDREIIYVAPLRRFSLEPGNELSDYNLTSYRNGRVVDTMQGFDAANDYLPGYAPVQPLLANPGSLVPSNLGGQEIPEELQNLPPVPEEIREHVPNEPYPDPPGQLPAGVPQGTPHPDDLEDWDPDHDGPLPWEPERVAEDIVAFAEDPTAPTAQNVTHRIVDGESRIIVRTHRQVVGASLNEVGYANFTVENVMEENEQHVGLFFSGPPNTRWLLRYGLDMPQGVKVVPPGGRAEMNLIAAPESLFSFPRWTGAAIFISDWGGIEIEPLAFISTTERIEDPRTQPGRSLILPERLEVVLVNDEDVFRVNEPRQVMVRVRDADTGQFVSQLTAVRAYIYPATTIPNGPPFQMREKPWMDGVYQIPFTFDRPGAWIIDVHFFDYPPGGPGGFPSEEFILRVELPGQAPPLMPSLAALASLGLVVAAVWARERLVKAR